MTRHKSDAAAEVVKAMTDMGGKWDAATKTWRVPKRQRAELDAALARYKRRGGGQRGR